MTSLLFILDESGDPMLIKQCKGELSLRCKATYPQRFKQEVLKKAEWDRLPILWIDGLLFQWVLRGDVYFLSISTRDENAMMTVSFLHSLGDLLEIYVSDFRKETLLGNFATIMELLDEVLDNGYPQITETKTLQSYIRNALPLNLSALTAMVNSSANKSLLIGRDKVAEAHQTTTSMTSAVSWRQQGIKHSKNEMWLDVIENIDAKVSRTGHVINCTVHGVLQMNTSLTGMPSLELGMEVTPDVTGPQGLDTLLDSRFHQSVDLARYSKDGVITFVPPDGRFELMTYRVAPKTTRALFEVDCTPNFVSDTKIDFVVRVASNYKPSTIATEVALSIPVPEDVDTPTFRAAMGSVKYRPDQNCIKWTVSNFSGGSEYVMTASFGLPSINHNPVKRNEFRTKPVVVDFEVPYLTVSGVSITYLRCHDVTGYKAMPWVRYKSQSGMYSVKMNTLA